MVKLGRVALKKFKGKGILPFDWELNIAQLEMQSAKQLSPSKEKMVKEMYDRLGICVAEVL